MKKILCLLVIVIAMNNTRAQTYALVADRLIDGSSNDAKDNPVVIVYKNKIVDINFNHKIPDSATVINLKGYTILPGMMDMHTHLLADGNDYDKDLYNNTPSLRALRAVMHLNTALQNGFTTLRDVCTEGAGYADVDLRKAVDSGYITGPKIYPSGKGIAATGNYFPMPVFQNWNIELPSGTQYATGHDECVRAVREQVNHGVSWIKLFADWINPTFDYDEIKAVVNEAKKYNVQVAAHATSREGIKMAIQAGVASIEHGDAFDDSLITMAASSDTYWCPTISVMEYFNYPLDSTYKYLNHAYKQNIKIVLGTDIGSYPWNNNEAKELEYYVKKAGLSPMDAIKTATLNPAALLKKQDKIGQIQKGFLADIIAVKGNPLDDITLLQHVSFVMKGGGVYKWEGIK